MVAYYNEGDFIITMAKTCSLFFHRKILFL